MTAYEYELLSEEHREQLLAMRLRNQQALDVWLRRLSLVESLPDYMTPKEREAANLAQRIKRLKSLQFLSAARLLRYSSQTSVVSLDAVRALRLLQRQAI